jgi:hypothetical protein
MHLDYPNLYYHAREKLPEVPHHSKAGNLVGGTEFVAKLDGGASEYIATLRCRHDSGTRLASGSYPSPYLRP